MPGFAADARADQFAEQRVFTARQCLPNLAVDRPTGTARLNDRSAWVQSHVPDLRLAGLCAMVNFSVHDQPAAHTAPECDVEDWIAPLPCSGQRFTERGDVRVIVDAHRQVRLFSEPFAQFELRPPLDLVRTADA